MVEFQFIPHSPIFFSRCYVLPVIKQIIDDLAELDKLLKPSHLPTSHSHIQSRPVYINLTMNAFI